MGGAIRRAVFLGVSVFLVSCGSDPELSIANGTLTFSEITGGSAKISWEAATDSETAASDLEYRVYQSSTANLGSVEDVEDNGTPLNAFTAGITSLDLTNLLTGNEYHFNVVVRNKTGQKAAYTQTSVSTTALIYLFATETVQGSFGTIAGALCSGAKYEDFASLPCETVQPFVRLELTGLDEYPQTLGVPADRPIQGPTGVPVANDWADLFDGSIENSMATALGLTTNYWTGVNSSGGGSNACFDNGKGTIWSLTTDDGAGAVGDRNSTDGQWLNDGSVGCSNLNALLCICY